MSNDKTLGFLFIGREDFPIAIAKIATSEQAAVRVERGYRALEQLRDCGVTARGLAPEPLALLSGPSGEIASVETAIRGTWLDGMLRPVNEAHYVQRLTDWLIELASATRASERDDAWPLFFRGVVEGFRENAAGLIDGALLSDACDRVATLDRLPTVFEHHDCTPWNFYVTPERRLVAFDWDNANPSGIPALDLIQSLGYLAFCVDGSLGSHRLAEAFRRRERGRLGAIREEARTRYAAAAGIDDSTMQAVRVFAWMRLSNDEFEGRRRIGSRLQRAEIERSMLGMWEAEARSAIHA
jgi:hypothetical protein